MQTRYRDAIKVAPPPKLVQRQWPDLPAMTVEEVKSMLDAGLPIQIIDTRPRHYSARAQDIMEGAVWRDPERVDEWIGELSKSDPWSRSASMVSTSVARQPRSYEGPDSMRATWRVAITRGRRRKGR